MIHIDGQIIGVLILMILVGIQVFVLPYYRNRHKKGEQDARTKE